jgi:hypothetical protein
MYTSLYDYLIKNGVSPRTAQDAVERIRHKVRLRVRLPLKAARLVKAARRALGPGYRGRGLNLFTPFTPDPAPVDQATVLPGDDVIDGDEGDEYVAIRPSPFDRLATRAFNPQPEPPGPPDPPWRGRLSVPEIQALAQSVAAGF